MEIGTTLYVKDRRQWRAWLARHHKTAPEIWLIYYKKHSGRPRIPYSDAVEEALCYGWIDSITKPGADRARLRSRERHEAEARVAGPPGHPGGHQTGSDDVETLRGVPRVVQTDPDRLDRRGQAPARDLPPAAAPLPQDDRPEQAVRDGAVTQLTLSTASMKLNVLVSTHSTDTASTFIVPMRSVLLVTARPLVGDGLMSRATAMPRRGSHLNVSVEASAVPAGVCGVNVSATVGYPPAVAVSCSMAAWWPPLLSASMNRSSTERTTVRRRSPHVRRRRSPSSCAGLTATCNFAGGAAAPCWACPSRSSGA